MQLPAQRMLRKVKGQSLVAVAIADLAKIDPKWCVEIGMPRDSHLWVSGLDFAQSADGPFLSLLLRIGERLGTKDRKTIAASFALRFGWTSSAAIAPFLLQRCVPDVSLSNVSLRCRKDTLFERTAIHVPKGIALGTTTDSGDSLTTFVSDESALFASLRSQLQAQAFPVVEALHKWSGFSTKGAWGQITSSWASQFVNVCDRFGGQIQAKPIVEAFFAGEDVVARMQPRLHPVTMEGVTHLYQRRASCCRYYLLPQGSLCAQAARSSATKIGYGETWNGWENS